MTIAITALKEKLRRKELYIVSAIGVLLLIVFGSGSGSLSINGQPITEYSSLAPVLLVTVNALCCILCVIMSVGTIPNEYERRTSHLIWIRKVPQYRYHGELALANLLSGLISEGILFGAMILFVIGKGRAAELFRLVPAYLLIAVNISIVCIMTSALSVLLPKPAAAAIASAVTLVGIFHSLLEVLKDIIGGFGGIMIKYALKLLPDLNGIQSEAAKALCGGAADAHVIFKGLLAVYVFAVIIIVYKRKEA